MSLFFSALFVKLLVRTGLPLQTVAVAVESPKQQVTNVWCGRKWWAVLLCSSRPQRWTTKLWCVHERAALLHSGGVCKDLVRGWTCWWRHTLVLLDV